MTTTTKYIWDQQNYLAEADGADTINVVYTNEPQQYGALVSTVISGVRSYHHFDVIGSTRHLTNSSAHVSDTIHYDAWGNPVARTGTTTCALLWIGETAYYTDPEVADLYVRRRRFAPDTGRWTSFDPAVQGTNWFAYVLNRPSALIDPSGLKVLLFCYCNFLGSTHPDPFRWSAVECLSGNVDKCCGDACRALARNGRFTGRWTFENTLVNRTVACNRLATKCKTYATDWCNDHTAFWNHTCTIVCGVFGAVKIVPVNNVAGVAAIPKEDKKIIINKACAACLVELWGFLPRTCECLTTFCNTFLAHCLSGTGPQPELPGACDGINPWPEQV